MIARRVAALALFAVALGPVQAQEVQHPETFLGHPVGADFELPDWEQVSGYFRQLAEQSPRVDIERVGTTTEGREFLLATIASEENLARLAQVRRWSSQLADPRGLDAEARETLLAEAPLVLFVSCQMHSTETAASSFAMEFAYLLATSTEEPWVSAREQVVVLLAPSLNPDGLDHVSHWYRETRGTPHEGAWMLRLYQLYAGHDNNRDWFGLTQAETRIVTRLLYSQWFPQIYWDVHQQGRGRERFFVPPYRDPLNPNLDPGVITAIDALGSRALLDMTREGFSGVSTGVTYDMWWNGGNRNVPVRHNIVGILTEAASVNLGSPVFLAPDELQAPRGLGAYAPSSRFPNPWPGGWWRLRDIVDYELSFGRSLLGSLARERRTWQENALEAAERAIEAGESGSPVAWLIPTDNPDRGAVRRLAETLLLGGVELQRATGPVKADGRTYPAGTIVIERAQPYGQHVKDLFEVQRYPEGDPPYDVSGWSFPLLLGVRRVEVAAELSCERERIRSADQALGGFPSLEDSTRTWDSRDSDGWVRLFNQLLRSEPVRFALDGEQEGRFSTQAAPWGGEAAQTVKGLPRIGIYTPWAGNMDEGWLRWVFDRWGVPYVRVRNEMVRAGDLGAFLDVLLVPDVSASMLDDGRDLGTIAPRFAGGLAPEGAVAIEEFVREGGTLLTMGGSAGWAIDLFQLPLRDVTDTDADADADADADPAEPDADPVEFSCPGSVVRAIPSEHPLTTGLPSSLSVFFSHSAAWEVIEPEEPAGDEPVAPAPEVLLRYAPTRLLLSGWIQGPEVIADRAAWVRATHGEGTIHLFGFRPQYRGWSQQAFQLLFRAVALDQD